MSSKDHSLAEQDQAIGLYMNSLLDDGPGSTAGLDAPAAVTEVDGRPVPAWAQHPFVAHLLHTGPLQLALIHQEVAAILSGGDLLPARKDDPTWMLGAVEVEGCRISCVDTLGIVTGMQRRQRDAQQGKIVVLRDHDWALLCTRLSQVQLEPGEILWRGPDGRRPWLAGVSRDQQIVLLDAGGFTDYLVTMRS